jgi:hypothetical protein
MSQNKTTINDLNDTPSNGGELTEDEVARISGGQEQPQATRLVIIDTIHSSGCVTADAL